MQQSDIGTACWEWLQRQWQQSRRWGCTHARVMLPKQGQGVVQCPDCAQAWRIRWWQASCRECQKQVPTRLAPAWLGGKPYAGGRCCSGCGGHTFTLTPRWQVSYFSIHHAACEWVPLTQSQSLVRCLGTVSVSVSS